MLNYNTIEEYYNEGLWCVDQIHKAVNNGIISSQDFENITGKNFYPYEPYIFIIEQNQYDYYSPQDTSDWLNLFMNYSPNTDIKIKFILKNYTNFSSTVDVELEAYELMQNGAKLIGNVSIHNQEYQVIVHAYFDEHNELHFYVTSNPGQTFYIPVLWSSNGVGTPMVFPPFPNGTKLTNAIEECDYYCAYLERVLSNIKENTNNNFPTNIPYPINLYINANCYNNIDPVEDAYSQDIWLDENDQYTGRLITTPEMTWVPLTQIEYEQTTDAYGNWTNSTIQALIFEQTYQVENYDNNTGSFDTYLVHHKYRWDRNTNQFQDYGCFKTEPLVSTQGPPPNTV